MKQGIIRAEHYILRSIMDLCHLKISELEPQYQKCKGRVAFRGDIVKDDSGPYAVLTEQGSSASQMTAAKISWILYQDYQVAQDKQQTPVSVYTQVKMEDAPKLLQIPKSECPDIWIRLPRHKWPKSWSSMEETVVPLERNLYGHPSAGLFLGNGHLRKSCWSTAGRRFFKLGMSSSFIVKGLFLSVYVDDIKLSGKKQNINPMWKIRMKVVGV